MIRLPVTVTNLPPQPLIPSRIIASIERMRRWWTTHEQEYRFDYTGLAYFRPVFGDVPLAIGGTDPITFSDMADSGRRPFANDSSVNRYVASPLVPNTDWSSFVVGFRADPNINSTSLASIQYNEGSLIIRPIVGGNSAQGGGIDWRDGATSVRLAQGPRPISDRPQFITVAHNKATGQVKFALDDAAPTVSGPTAATSATNWARMTVGATPGVGGFPGHILNAGHISGDIFANPLSRQLLAQYRTAVYGV